MRNKQSILTLVFLLSVLTSFGQVASRLLPTQANPQPISAPNFMWVDTNAAALTRIWVASPDSLKIRAFQMRWLKDSVTNFTSPLYKPLSWFPTWLEVTGKPSFSSVALSGQYSDLLGRPTLFSGSYTDLTNIPTIFPTNISNVSGLTAALNNKIEVGASIPYNTISGTPTLSTVATTGQYTDLIGLPSLFSGSYLDLTNKPTVFPTDISNVSGLTSALNNKVSVGAPISYSVLTGTPTIPTNTNQLTNGANFITYSGAPVQSVNGQTGAVNLTIPAAQIQSDWNQSNSSSVDFIKNKPVLGTAAATNSTDYATAAQGSLATSAVQPATLSNYVTNNSLSTTLGGYTTTTALNAGLAGKENTISAGTTGQYWRGDKTWQTLNTTSVTEGTNLYYTDTRARSSVSAGTGIGYNSTTGVITNTSPDQVVSLNSGTGISVTGTYPSFTVSSSVAAPTINNSVSRTFNSNYTVSSTRMSIVNYSVSISVTNPLLAGNSTASVFLEYSTNSGSTWITASQVSNTSGVGLAVAVAITNSQGSVLTGYIPANALVRLRTTTSGTASVTYVAGQEVLN